MQGLAKGIENNALDRIAANASPRVLAAIQDASSKTGVNFAYMVQQASAESSFNPSAKAKTSSATGLYQFINSTWMNMVEKYGDKHGLETEGKSKSEILNMRKDPEIASVMAAEFASENERFLQTHWAKGEKDIGSTELYFAHFMGAGGAAAFLNARDENPLQSASVLFPKAAAANKNVFYDSKGQAKSLEDVYAFFDKKFSVDDIEMPQAIEVAELAAPAPTAIMPSTPSPVEHSRIYSSIYTANQKAKTAQLLNPTIPSSYQSLLQNPIDLLLMTQLEMPFQKSDKTALF